LKYNKIKFREIDPLQDYYGDGTGAIYSVAKLIDDTKKLKPFDLPLCGINLSDVIWNECNIQELAFHVQRVNKADLSKPIILDWNGNVADGRHRLIKAIVKGKKTIKAVRMHWKPTPCRIET